MRVGAVEATEIRAVAHTDARHEEAHVLCTGLCHLHAGAAGEQPRGRQAQRRRSNRSVHVVSSGRLVLLDTRSVDADRDRPGALRANLAQTPRPVNYSVLATATLARAS